MNPRCIENEMNQSNMMDYGVYSENMTMDMHQGMMNPGCMCPPIYECPTERICERYIMHEVPHIVPINTKMVNHHVYRHTYTPCYTYSECDTCENIYDPCNKNFF